MTTAVSVRPSYRQRFARNRGDAAHPGLWDGLIGLFAPRLGITGSTLRDCSPLRNHGVLTNMENADDWSPASDGYNLNFGGTNEYVTAPSNAAYNLTTAASVLADLMFTSSAVDQGICFRGSNANFGSPGNRWYFYSDDAPRFSFGSKVGTSAFTVAVGNGAINTTNVRYRVAATFDNNRATKWRFYVNGSEYAQSVIADNGAWVSDTAALDIGRLGSVGTFQYLTGPLYELAIYNYAIPDDMGLRWSMGASPLDMKPRLWPVYVSTSGSTSLTATDSATVSESVTRIGSFARTATAAPTVSESVTRTLGATRTTTDVAQVSEAISRIVAFTRTSTDTPQVSESLTRVLNALRTTADSPTTSESVARSLNALRTTTDTPTTSESATRSLSALRGSTDAPTTSELTTRTLTATRSTTDSVSLSEVAVAGKILNRSVTESLSVLESATRTATLQRSGSDTPVLSEVASRVQALNRATSDTPTVSESVIASTGGGNVRQKCVYLYLRQMRRS